MIADDAEDLFLQTPSTRDTGGHTSNSCRNLQTIENDARYIGKSLACVARVRVIPRGRRHPSGAAAAIPGNSANGIPQHCRNVQAMPTKIVSGERGAALGRTASQDVRERDAAVAAASAWPRQVVGLVSRLPGDAGDWRAWRPRTGDLNGGQALKAAEPRSGS